MNKENIEKLEKEYIKMICDYFNDNIYVELIEFVLYNINLFGIKIRIYENTYLFEYNGTIDDLLENLDEKVEEKKRDFGKCPFCENEKLYIDWYKCDICDNCGSNVIRENSKPNNLLYLIKECGGKEIITNENKDFKIWFIPKENEHILKELENSNMDEKFNEYINNLNYDKCYLSNFNFVKFECEKFNDNEKLELISRDYIYRIIFDIGQMFCEWITKTSDYEYEYEIEYEIDNQIDSNKYFKIKKYETIHDWLMECYTGNYKNTYCSGRGRIYDTMIEDVYDILSKYTNEILLKYYNVEYYEDIVEDGIVGDLEFYINYSYLYDNILNYLKNVSPCQFWNEYNHK
ncbi:hypothetical protein M0Q97_02315 [Candidatus Dojkabacteria bacterium]|jgi:hypothetical protein|nr:hypothetical protein [Candidatus Dojkabacteria bacterium]